MKILLVGGTQFIGKHVIHALVAEGHKLTLLNRGRTNPDPGFPLIRADRSAQDLHSLPELLQEWDAIIDLSAYYPKDVASLLNAVAGRYQRYILCSTVSVYEGFSREGDFTFSENSPLLSCTFEECADTSMETYGKRKAECERVALSLAGQDKTVILRPSVVYGAHDYTDRFAYWIWRAAHNSPFILPEGGMTVMTMTYAPDLGRAFAAALHSPAALGEAYNIAEATPLNFHDRIKIIAEHLHTEPLKFAVSFDSARLLSLGIKSRTDLPLWLPKSNRLIDSSKSRRDLNFRETPIKESLATAADVFLAENRPPQCGLSTAAEKELLSRRTH